MSLKGNRLNTTFKHTLLMFVLPTTLFYTTAYAPTVKEKAELEESVKKVSNEVELIKEDVGEKQVIIKELEEEVETIHKNNDELQSTIDEKTQLEKEIKADNQDLKSENESLKEEMEGKNSEISELEQKVSLETESKKVNSSNEKEEVKNKENNSKIDNTKTATADDKQNNSNPNPSPVSESEGKSINVQATAYTAFCDTGCTGVTATGHDVSSTVYKDGKRVIAADPSVIPLGTTVKVETETMSFTGVVSDTGGAIKGNKIDVLVDDKGKAVDFGRQSATVTVLN